MSAPSSDGLTALKVSLAGLADCPGGIGHSPVTWNSLIAQAPAISRDSVFILWAGYLLTCFDWLVSGVTLKVNQ